MNSAEAFRIRLFPPGGVIAAEELVLRIKAASEKVRAILRPFLRESRIAFESPVDGEGWLVVLVRDDLQMNLQFEVQQRLVTIRKLEVEGTAAAFRSHCEGLIYVIRKARLDRQELDDLYRQAGQAHKELASVSSRGEGASLDMVLRAPGAEAWMPSIPVPPAYMRVKDETVTVIFNIESVGEDFANILLDRPSRRVMSADRARTVLCWKPLEQPRNTSTFLHRRMLRNAKIQAICSRIYKKNGQLHGLALHSLLK